MRHLLRITLYGVLVFAAIILAAVFLHNMRKNPDPKLLASAPKQIIPAQTLRLAAAPFPSSADVRVNAAPQGKL